MPFVFRPLLGEYLARLAQSGLSKSDYLEEMFSQWPHRPQSQTFNNFLVFSDDDDVGNNGGPGAS